MGRGGMGKKARKVETSDGWVSGNMGNILCLALAGGIAYCRYNSIAIPVLDDIIAKAQSALGIGGGGGGPVHDAKTTLADAEAGKVMAVEDLLLQLNKFCGRKGSCTEEYWNAVPTVTEAVKR